MITPDNLFSKLILKMETNKNNYVRVPLTIDNIEMNQLVVLKSNSKLVTLDKNKIYYVRGGNLGKQTVRVKSKLGDVALERKIYNFDLILDLRIPFSTKEVTTRKIKNYINSTDFKYRFPRMKESRQHMIKRQVKNLTGISI
jgi:hypothetical protein